MKKNKILILLSILVLLVIITGCSNKINIKKYTKKMNESMNSVTNVETSITIKDSDVVVYQYMKESIVENEKLSVKIDIKTLDENFSLSNTSSVETFEELNRSSLLPFQLRKNLLLEYRLEDENLICKVTSNNFLKLYSFDDLKIDGDVEIVLNFKDNKIISINSRFKNVSGKDVMISTKYGY